MQALIVCFFIIKDKERALGGGEPIEIFISNES
jgi:hypothetical protein